MSWLSRCSWCGGPFNSGNCRHCTNVSFGDEPVYDSNPNSTPDFSNPLPHHNYETDSRSDTGAAFQAEFAKFQQNFERFMAQLSCSHCGGLFNGGNCPSCSIVGAGNEFVHDPNPFPYNNTPDFYDQPPQHHVETYSCELCGNDSHYGYDCPPRFPLVYEQEPSYNQNFGDNYYPQNSPSFSQQYLCCDNCGGPDENFQCQPMNQKYFKPNPSYNPNYSRFDQPPQYPIDQSPAHEMSIQEMEDLKQHYLDEMLSLSNDLQIKDYRNEKIDIHFRRECESMIDELKGKFNGMSIEINKKKKLQHLEQESTIPLNEIDSQIPPSNAITPVLPTLEPKDSLIIGDEHLSTIPEKELDEFIKSSVEDLVPIPSESEDTSESDRLSEDNVKIYSNPLFEFDDEYISSDVNPVFDEVLENIESKDSYVSNLDEPVLLVTPLFDFNKDECFNPGGDVDEIELLLHRDPSTPKMSVVSILEGFTDKPPQRE
ncbi:hypothetical protein Tco_0781860 [Tanacetum coccineum]